MILSVKLLTHLVINEVSLLAGRDWEKDQDGWGIACLTKGFGYWIDGKQLKDVATGDLMVIGPVSKGAFRASQLCDSLIHIFYFRPENLVGLLSAGERLGLESLRDRDKCRVIPSREPVAQLYRELLAGEQGRRTFFQRCRLLNIAALTFSDVWSAVREPDAHFPTVATRIEELVSKISDAELIKCDAEALANLCGCNVRTFRRVFRKLFNTSVRAKRRELRFEKARQLLAETDLPISTIAKECGFGDLALFYALFKKRFGMPPKAWRGLTKGPPPPTPPAIPPQE